MSVMGNRVSVELERERLFELRTQEQKRALALQNVELAHTRKVLRTMVEGASLIECASDDDDLLDRQTTLLRGVLGFEGVHLHKGLPEHPGAMAKTWSLEQDSYSLELWGSTADISDAYTQIHLSALADHIALTVATFRLQRALVKAHDDLHAAQDRLIQAEKLGVVGALAATVAHDIRNIMASVSLEAESEDDPEEALARVRRQVARFSVLSHRLLSYVKPKYMARQLLNVNESMRKALDLLGPQIRASRVHLNVDLASQLPRINADSNQLEHLFVNLIVNALQAVSRSDGALSLASTFEGNEVQVRVQDNGRGIDPAVIDRVFDPFYSSRPDGFGLGLFSCRRIAEEHGWRLDVESQPNNGSSFVLHIPVEAQK
jgi:signal transduction histidine kinase